MAWRQREETAVGRSAADAVASIILVKDWRWQDVVGVRDEAAA
jgi:hypothetical protein